MSWTWSITCPKTLQKLWIGQGTGEMETLYTGDERVMHALHEFLKETAGLPLVFRCDDTTDDLLTYTKFKPDSTVTFDPLDAEALRAARYSPLRLDSYMDGGTVRIERLGRVYYVDFRRGTAHRETRGRWTHTRPWDEKDGFNPVLVAPEEIKSVQEALERGYRDHRCALVKCVPGYNPLKHVLSAPEGTVLTWLPPTKLGDLPLPVPGLVAPALEDDGSSAFAFFIVSAGCSVSTGGVTTYSDFQWFRHDIYT